MRGRGRGTGRTLATVFFTDMVGSTELAARLGDQRWRQLLDTYHRVVRQAIRRGGGREVDSAGDGFFAVFDSPAGAIRTAAALTDELHRLGLEVRTGLHTGEVELMGGKVGGIAVHLGARVGGVAGPGEILLTSTVRDLVAGSDTRFVDRGMRTLKGIPGEWHIYAVERPGAVPLAPEALEVTAGQRARTRRTRRILPVGAAGVVLVAVAAASAVIAARHGSSSPAAASVTPGPDSVGHLDASASAFTTAVKTGGRQPTDVAVGGGAVWVLNYQSATLVRVDAPTGALVGTSAVGGPPTGVAFGAGAVWITTEFGLTGGVGGSVIRFNPVTNGIDKVITVGDGVQAVAFGSQPEAVWATNQLENTVIRIDTATNAVSATIQLGHRPEALAVGADGVWVGAADMTLLHIDPATNTVIRTIQLRTVPTAVAVGDGAVWIASSSANSVTRVDPASDRAVLAIPVDTGPTGIAAADGAVWVAASVAGTVDRIDPATNRVIAHTPVQGHPHGVAAAGPDAWVTVAAQ
jgi:YVTN family beta-propeller protein